MGDADQEEEIRSLNSTVDYMSYHMDRFLDMCTAMSEIQRTHNRNMAALLSRLTDPFATNNNVTISEADTTGSPNGLELLGSQADEGQLDQAEEGQLAQAEEGQLAQTQDGQLAQTQEGQLAQAQSVLSVIGTGTVLTPIDTNVSTLQQATIENVLPANRSSMTGTNDQENLNVSLLRPHADQSMAVKKEALENSKDQKSKSSSISEESHEHERSDSEATTEEVDEDSEDDIDLESPPTILEQTEQNESDNSEVIEDEIFENERTSSEDNNQLRNPEIIQTLPRSDEIDGSDQESSGLQEEEEEIDVDAEGVPVMNESLKEIRDQKSSISGESDEYEMSDSEVTTEEEDLEVEDEEEELLIEDEEEEDLEFEELDFEDEEMDVDLVDLTSDDDYNLEPPPTIFPEMDSDDSDTTVGSVNLEQAQEVNKSEESYENETIEKENVEMDKFGNVRTPPEDNDEMRNPEFVDTLPDSHENRGNNQESDVVEEDEDDNGLESPSAPAIFTPEISSNDSETVNDSNFEKAEENESDKSNENETVENVILEMDKFVNEPTRPEDKAEMKYPEFVDTLPESQENRGYNQESDVLEEDEDGELVNLTDEDGNGLKSPPAPAILSSEINSDHSETVNDSNLEQSEENESDKSNENEGIEKVILEMDKFENERTPPEDKDEMRNPEFVDTLPDSHKNHGNNQESEVLEEVEDVELVHLTAHDDSGLKSPPAPAILTCEINSDHFETVNDANLEQAEENESDKSNENEPVENVIVELEKFENERTPPEDKDEMINPEFVDTIPQSHENRGNNQESESLEEKEEEDFELVDLTGEDSEDDDDLESPPTPPAILTSEMDSDHSEIKLKYFSLYLDQSEENKSDESYESETIEKGNFELDNDENERSVSEDKNEMRNQEIVDNLPESHEIHGKNQKSTSLEEEEEDMDMEGDWSGGDNEGLRSPASEFWNVPLGGQENLANNLDVNYATVGLSSCIASGTGGGSMSLPSTASVICSLSAVSALTSLLPTSDNSCLPNVLETETDTDLNGNPFLPPTTNETEIGYMSEGSEDSGPIDLSLTGRQNNDNERSCRKRKDESTMDPGGRKKPRKQQIITNDIDMDDSSEPEPEPEPNFTFWKVKKIKNYTAVLPKPVGEIEGKSKEVPSPEEPSKHGVGTIPDANEVPIGVKPIDSEQDSDDKDKEGKVQTIWEIVNQENIFKRVSEWKLTELLNDFDQIVDMENDTGESCNLLLSKIEGFGSNQTYHQDLNRIQELLNGNIKRCKEIRVQVAESGYVLGRIMRHKARVHQVINKFNTN